MWCKGDREGLSKELSFKTGVLRQGQLASRCYITWGVALSCPTLLQQTIPLPEMMVAREGNGKDQTLAPLGSSAVFHKTHTTRDLHRPHTVLTCMVAHLVAPMCCGKCTVTAALQETLGVGGDKRRICV